MKKQLKGGNEKEFKEENTISNIKEVEMVKRKSKRKVSKPSIDGVGSILLIAGLSLLFFGQNKSTFNSGILVLIIGFLRILYILWRRD